MFNCISGDKTQQDSGRVMADWAGEALFRVVFLYREATSKRLGAWMRLHWGWGGRRGQRPQLGAAWDMPCLEGHRGPH